MAKVKATPDKPVESMQGNVGEKGSYEVTIDNSYEEVVRLNKEGYVLNFSMDSFLELDDATLDELSRRNFANYFVSKHEVERRKLEKKRRPEPNYLKDMELKVLGSNAKRRMRNALRLVKKGWHGCLKAPDEVEEALGSGYRFVYRLSNENQKLVDTGEARYEDFADDPGTSTPVRIGQEDKPELIAMQIPESKWKEHLAAVGYKSRGKWERHKGDFMERAERAGLIPKDYEKGGRNEGEDEDR